MNRLVLRNLKNCTKLSTSILKLKFASCFSTDSLVEPAGKDTSKEFSNVEDFRNFQLARLQSFKSSEFSPAVLNQIIADYLVSSPVPDLNMAGSLIDKFLFKFPGIDEGGDLSSLYMLYLIQSKKTVQCCEFLKNILTAPQNIKINITPFMLESIWNALVILKDDTSAFSLLKLLHEIPGPHSEFMTNEFKTHILVDLLLPRLNWNGIDFIVSHSVKNGQITVSNTALEEIFHAVLSPSPDDVYNDTIESEPFSGNIVNPRFHRLIHLLERWKLAGIPVKGKEMADALEGIFRRFLPTEAMMKQLQALI